MTNHRKSITEAKNDLLEAEARLSALLLQLQVPEAERENVQAAARDLANATGEIHAIDARAGSGWKPADAADYLRQQLTYEQHTAVVRRAVQMATNILSHQLSIGDEMLASAAVVVRRCLQVSVDLERALMANVDLIPDSFAADGDTYDAL